ncbi:MAG: hypothetical protein K8J31_01700 [Anaerolineae bacterium]|nr:hypothetical protein [Anaerolineae bacterium]
MSHLKKMKWTMILVVIVGAVLALSALGAAAQDNDSAPCDFGQVFGYGPQGMMGGSMMGQGMRGQNVPQNCLQDGYYGMGMMGGMMGQLGGMGHMMGFDPDTMGRFGPGTGMMGAWTPPADLAPTAGTLTLDEATQVASAYIAAWNSDRPLELSEVMQFDNHFYGEAVETETGRAAFEFLIDPQTGTVVGEPGPNMMWNLRYGMPMGRGMGMFRPAPGGDEMTVTSDEARTDAQAFLDQVLPGTQAAEDYITAFDGYYTLHVTRDNDIIGMLSVNGYTGQVWLHHWHGNFITMTSHE